MEQNSPNLSPQKISTALAAAQARSAVAASVRFPAEDGGRSLADMAQRDLDAALQLLADRAQYITGATGAAIALRRDGKNDMLCRASTGTNAPELGALLSTEFGLSGESVRTKQALRCDDAERDARVNREVCRQLGIASVVVMPVVHDDQVLGVFELFSGKAHAFGERDLSAIQRLSEMVETAVRLADGPANAKDLKKDAAKGRHGQFVRDLVVESGSKDAKPGTPAVASTVTEAEAAKPVAPVIAQPVVPAGSKVEVPLAEAKAAPARSPEVAPVSEIAPAKKPLFWSAALAPENESAKPAEGGQSNVPPVLRGLRKCEACGFPVSAGRVLCVECEEKKWRGQLRPQARAVSGSTAASGSTLSLPSPKTSSSQSAGLGAAAAATMAKAAPAASGPSVVPSSPAVTPASSPVSKPLPKEDVTKATQAAAPAVSKATEGASESVRSLPSAEFVLSAAAQPSQSWLVANKYIIAVLLAIAVAAAVVFYLR